MNCIALPIYALGIIKRCANLDITPVSGLLKSWDDITLQVFCENISFRECAFIEAMDY